MKLKIISLILAIVLCICVSGCGGEDESLQAPSQETVSEETAVDGGNSSEVVSENTSEEEALQITELQLNDAWNVSDVTCFTMVNLTPCVVVDGVAYLYEDDTWVAKDASEAIQWVYEGEYYCALDVNGKILGEPPADSSGYMPLGSASVFNNAEVVMEKSATEPVRALDCNVYSDAVLVWLQDGSLIRYMNGEGIEVEIPGEIKQISDGYVLTEDGYLYEVSGEIGEVKVKKVSEEAFTEFPLQIKVEETVKTALTDTGKKAEDIVVSFDRAAVLCEDGSIVLLDM